MSNNDKQHETIKGKGRTAYLVGQSIAECPYQTNGPYGRKYRCLWIAGYVEARDNVKAELSHDNAH